MSRLLFKFLIFGFWMLPFVLHAFTVPTRPSTYVADYASVIPAEDEASLETKLRDFEKSSTNEISVVTIQSLDGDTVENVAQEIFTAWGIGKKEKNNGLLFLISISDRKTRIHTGYGVEGQLTDIGTSYIQRDILAPAFRDGNYGVGINGAVDSVIAALGGLEIVPKDYRLTSLYDGLPWDIIIFVGFVAVQFLMAILGRSKDWWHGGVLGGVVAIAVWHFFINSLLTAIPVLVGFVGFGLLLDYIASKAHSHHEHTGMYPWWFGGGGGGDGFGGFGGGMSGGGGSGGSW